jgi:hypothetical protein
VSAAGLDRAAHLVASVGLLAQPGGPDYDSPKGPEWGKAAPIGLLIILLLGIALFLLIRSMNKQLRKVPKTFDRSGGRGRTGSAAAPTPPDPAAADDEIGAGAGPDAAPAAGWNGEPSGDRAHTGPAAPSTDGADRPDRTG